MRSRAPPDPPVCLVPDPVADRYGGRGIGVRRARGRLIVAAGAALRSLQTCSGGQWPGLVQDGNVQNIRRGPHA